jgi:hypothetical protein
MAQSLRRFGAFVFQDGVDSRNAVMRILSNLKLSLAFDVVRAGSRYDIYVVVPKEQQCRSRCVYDEGCGSDEGCVRECTSRCVREVVSRAADLLENYAERHGKRRSRANNGIKH